MPITRRALLASASAMALSSSSRSSPTQEKPLRFRITALPLLSGGDYSRVSAINNKGQAVGLSSNGQTIVSNLLRDTRAVLWSEGTVRDLVLQQFSAPQGYRINDRGQILLNWQYIGAEKRCGVPSQEDYIVLWDGNVKRVWHQHDGFLPTNITNHGDIVGRIPRLMGQAALWQGGKAIPIAFPANVVSSQALVCNDAGLVAGTFARSQDHGEEGLFVWRKGKLDIIAADNARTAFYPGGINAKGQVAGIFRETKTRIAHLCIWEDGKLVDRGALGREGLALGINDNGDVVGKADWGAFIATDGAKSVKKLSDFLPPDSGWTLNEATGINDKRQIVGNGQFQGQFRAFLMMPEI